jgi:hypothetical protein
MAQHRFTVLAGAVALAWTLQTPLSASADSTPVGRALELYSASAEAAYWKAVSVDASRYAVTSCSVGRVRGSCRARLYAVSDLGWVRSDFTVRGTWRKGRLTVVTGPDRWTLKSKGEVYDETDSTGARRRGPRS